MKRRCINGIIQGSKEVRAVGMKGSLAFPRLIPDYLPSRSELPASTRARDGRKEEITKIGT